MKTKIVIRIVALFLRTEILRILWLSGCGHVFKFSRFSRIPHVRTHQTKVIILIDRLTDLERSTAAESPRDQLGATPVQSGCLRRHEGFGARFPPELDFLSESILRPIFVHLLQEPKGQPQGPCKAGRLLITELEDMPRRAPSSRCLRFRADSLKRTSLGASSTALRRAAGHLSSSQC